MKKIWHYILAFVVFEVILIFLYWGTTSIKEKEYFKIKLSTQNEFNKLNFSEFNRTALNFLNIVESNSTALNLPVNLKSGSHSVSNLVSIFASSIREAHENGITTINFYTQNFKYKIDTRRGNVEKTTKAQVKVLKNMIATSFKKFALYIGEHSIIYRAVYPIKLRNDSYAFLELGFTPQSYEKKLSINPKNDFLHLVFGDKLNNCSGYRAEIFNGLYYFPGEGTNKFFKSNDLLQIIKKFRKNHLIKEIKGSSNSIDLSANGNDFILSYFPLRSITGEKIGYLFNFSEDNFIGQMRFEFQLLLGFSSLMLLIIFVYSYSEYSSKLKAQKANAILSSIKESPENVAILSLDKNYKILAFSKSYKRLFKEYYGSIVEEGKNKLDYHKDALEIKQLRSYFDRAFKGEEFLIVERLENSKGEVKYFENRYNAISDKDNKIIGLTVFIADVTENKLAEKKLQKLNRSLENQIAEKERFEKILKNNNRFLNIIMDTIPSPFYFQNNTGIIRGCNTSFAENILGYAKNEVIGKTINQILGEEDKTLSVPFSERNSLLIERGGAESYEASVKLSNGKLREMLFYKAAFTDETEQITGIVCVMIDITERKQSVAMLSTAKQAAEEANRAKSYFLASMSHELRTPLNGILGYTQLLKKDETLSEFQKNAVNTIHISGEHLLALINDVLDISKIEAKKLELSNSNFNLNSLLKNIVDVFKMRSEKKGVRFVYEEKNTAPRAILGDEVRVRQIIYNLIGNALKFTDSGTITFVVQFVPESSEFIKFKIKIIDTGRGIPNEKLREIFQPFKQIEMSGKKITGTGLGLAITLNLIEMMRGKINVKSEVGKGTTFYVDLILAKAVEKIYEIEGSEIKIIGYQGIKKKILIVDDTEQVREFLSRTLAPLGFSLAEAQNGLEALVKVNDFSPDIILMDLVMPVMNGLETIKSVRSDPYNKNLPIIALSASVFEDDQAQSMSAGSDVFMPKPIDVDQLLKNIGTLLKIEWKYERVKIIRNLTEQYSEVVDNSSAPAGEIPDKEILNKVRQCAQLGDISGISSILKTLEKEERFEKFVIKIGNFNSKFDTESILNEIIRITNG